MSKHNDGAVAMIGAVSRDPAPVAAERLPARLLTQVLDEFNDGVIVIGASGRIAHLNIQAQRELAVGRLLRGGLGQALEASDADDQLQVQQAVLNATRDCRSIVEIAGTPHGLSLAFIPVRSDAAAAGVECVLVLCARTEGVQALTIHMYARARGLTVSERAVLEQLCAGRSAEGIAETLGVQLSTVRTHIKNVRHKTGTNSIGEIVRRVSRLPQIVPSVRVAA